MRSVLERCVLVRWEVVWKAYVDKMMNEENVWGDNVEGDVVEGPVICVGKEDFMLVLIEMKTG